VVLGEQEDKCPAPMRLIAGVGQLLGERDRVVAMRELEPHLDAIGLRVCAPRPLAVVFGNASRRAWGRLDRLPPPTVVVLRLLLGFNALGPHRRGDDLLSTAQSPLRSRIDP